MEQTLACVGLSRGVVQGSPIHVVTGIDVAPELHQQLNEIRTSGLRSVVQCCAVEAHGIHISS